MAFRFGWRGPNIVKNGLVLYLDASSPTSYSPYINATTWRDISGNTNNGTLTNGPTFDTANGGSIVFNGSTQYVNCGNNSSLNLTTSLTVCQWIKPSNVSGASTFSHKGDYTTATNNNGWTARVDGSLIKFFLENNNEVLVTSNSNSISVNNIWYYISLWFDGTNAKIFINGSQNGTIVAASIGSSLSEPYEIGRKDHRSSGAITQYFAGNISNVSVYNRALSAQEILQNYNATKTRFGL